MENQNHLNNDNKNKILFFGRHGCIYSKQAFSYLQHLGFHVDVVFSKDRKESLPDFIQEWEGDYIICYRSYFFLPRSVLDKALIAAINFHPAPPEYPGSGCMNWALYEKAKMYGVTAHIMNEKIDNGAIVECRRFPILPQDNVLSLLERTHLKAYDLLIDITTGLATIGKTFLDKRLLENESEKWSTRKAKKMSAIDQMQIIDTSCSKDELEKIIRATCTPNFRPEIILHGYKFALK